MSPVPSTHAGEVSQTMFSRVLGGMSIFTMLMTIPQVLTIMRRVGEPRCRGYRRRAGLRVVAAQSATHASWIFDFVSKSELDQSPLLHRITP